MTFDEIKELIKTDETSHLEMKKTTGELKDGMHSLCAMLNSDGGYVIFGIAPGSMKIVGQMVTDNTRKEIGREIRKLEPFVNRLCSGDPPLVQKEMSKTRTCLNLPRT